MMLALLKRHPEQSEGFPKLILELFFRISKPKIIL